MHLICEVTPRRYTIRDQAGNAVVIVNTPLIEIPSKDKEPRFINPVHNLAWHDLMERANDL